MATYYAYGTLTFTSNTRRNQAVTALNNNAASLACTHTTFMGMGPGASTVANIGGRAACTYAFLCPSYEVALNFLGDMEQRYNLDASGESNWGVQVATF